MRELILSEIRRLAAESGRPPGKLAFERATGITEGKWSGRLWARWGDALKEAGFEPNPLTPKLDKNLLLQKLTDCCRHFGRWPSQSELKLYRVQVDRTFPTETTLRDHFGGRDGQISSLRDCCVNHGIRDVITLLPNEPSEQISQNAKAHDGYVYLLRSGRHYKIGQCQDLEKRIKQITIALPEKVTLLHAIATDDPPGIEAYWHRRFDRQRANGEWFKLTPSDIAAFCRRRFQ
jgi:hypothetical protein